MREGFLSLPSPRSSREGALIWFIIVIAILVYGAGFISGWLWTLRRGFFCFKPEDAATDAMSFGEWRKRYLARMQRRQDYDERMRIGGKPS